MSNIRTDYALFDIIDYKNEAVLSSYNLSITPLTFKARIPDNDDRVPPLNDVKATFDFGDGSFGHLLTSSHVYEYPGKYTVRMVLRDCNNDSVLASYSTDVIITDYVINTFTVDGVLLNDLNAGVFSDPITITSQTPVYQDFQDIYFSLSGNDFPNYFNLNSNKFNNLKKYYSFYKKNYLPVLSGFEYTEINKISLSSENIFVKLSSYGSHLSAVSIVNCISTDPGSILVGSSGNQIVYFKTDEQDPWETPITISLFKDRNNIFAKGVTGYKNTDYLNNFTISVSSVVGATSGQSISSIAITSNGIPGESDEVDTFNISPVQYKGLGIPFILSPKNSNNYTMKALSAGTAVFSLLSGHDNALTGVAVDTQYYTISSLNNTLSTITTNFWYRGLLTFNDGLSTAPAALALSARCLFENTQSSTVTTITGVTPFTCYPKNYYEVYKHNEDINYQQVFEDLRFQEILLDKNILFTDFLGTIFGDVSSNYTVLGKKLWEKVFNFPSNNNDIDFCDINSLISLSELVDDPGLVFDRSLAQQPALLERILSNLSVSYNNFRGTQNKFEENYDPVGRTTKTKYGKNLGEKLDSLTYEITGGTDIVAYEKYSQIYTRLNTFQPLCALSGAAISTSGNVNTYMLSDYSTYIGNASGATFWGWPLMLPGSFTITDVNKFYDFYSLSAAYDNTIIGGLVDYSNGLTTLSHNTPLSSLIGQDNIFDIMIRNTLFSSLSLF
tara:strand:+ start:939 stop:3122 length:2184 start_codon:yes stop_codon:yes gene_type:complete